MAHAYLGVESLLAVVVVQPSNVAAVAELRERLAAGVGTAFSDDDFVALLACHTITAPLLGAIYPEYDIVAHSFVAARVDEFLRATAGAELDALLSCPSGEGDSALSSASDLTLRVANELCDINDSAVRAEITKTIYERLLFAVMYEKALGAGVGYTPIAVVDFLIRSSDDLMRKHFGRGVSDEGVVVYEPFAGTGSFITRMFAMPGLISDQDFWRKYEREIYAQEFLLIPYYVGDLVVEEAALARMGERRPFVNSVFGDTFAAHEERDSLFYVDNAGRERAFDDMGRAKSALREKDVSLVLSNPPFNRGKRSAEEGERHATYEKLEASMDRTYGRQKGISLKTLWAKGMRVATDRVNHSDGGMVSFVMPTSWLRTSHARGFRQSVAEEFDAIYVLDCLGNSRSGHDSERQGASLFGGDGTRGARISCGVVIFVRLPQAQRTGECVIRCKEIDGFLDRSEDKHAWLADLGSMANVDDWTVVAPDARYDWFDQIGEEYEHLVPLGDDATKAGVAERAVFKSYSFGLCTGEDERAANSSRDVLRPLIQAAADEWNEMVSAGTTWEPTAFREHNNQMGRIKSGHRVPDWDEAMIRTVWHRPFSWQECRWSRLQNQGQGSASVVFPSSASENVVFAPGRGGTGMPMMLPIELNYGNGRYFYPLRAYASECESEGGGWSHNVTDYALALFCDYYGDESITKDDIFYYVLGALNRVGYRERWGSALQSSSLKHLRVEWLPDFWRQAKRGRTLTKASCLVDPSSAGKPGCALRWEGEDYRLGKHKMRADREERVLRINETTSACDIPEEMWLWEYNERSAMWWLCNRWRVKVGKVHGVVNDPNDLFGSADGFRNYLERVCAFVQVSVRIDLELDVDGVVDVDVPLPSGG